MSFSRLVLQGRVLLHVTFLRWALHRVHSCALKHMHYLHTFLRGGLRVSVPTGEIPCVAPPLEPPPEPGAGQWGD